MKLLIIAEHHHSQLKNATLHTLSAAKLLSDEIDLLIMGFNCEAAVKEAQALTGVKRVLCADHEVYAHQLAENSAELITKLAADYAYILGPASTFGKNLLPRVAALLNVSMIGDVIKVISPDTFQRPIYAGNVVATVKTEEKIKVLTIRATAFPQAELAPTPVAMKVDINDVIDHPLSQFEDESLTVSTRPELTTARVIISGGRGLKNAENFHLLEKIADKLNAAVGASRAAVDAGFAPNDYQVGQTGKVVAPDLYIAVGISGAIQHLAGMKDSKVVVAINNDPDAPIFQVADYGVVGDLFKVLAELEEALSS